jgi:signal transduction histidine kinase
MPSQWIERLKRAERSLSVQGLLAAGLVMLMVIATGAMVSSTLSNIRTVERLSDQALNSTALALAATAERVLAERGDQKTAELRDLLSDRVIAYALIAGADGMIRFHTNPRLVGSRLAGFTDEPSLIPLNMRGRHMSLQTGIPAYEFTYVLHREDGTSDLLMLVLNTFPADRIRAETQGMWWSVAAGIGSLWLVGTALGWTLIRHARLEGQRQRQEHLAVIGRMTAVLAHEIRNAVGSVKGFTQWVNEKTEETDQRKVPLNLALRGTGRIESLVNDLLRFSRDEVYVIEAIDVAKVIDEALSVTAGTWQGRIERRVPQGMACLADKQKLLQALQNGIQNGLEAMGDEGVLGISAGTAGRWLTIAIKDTGPGVPPEVKERLFSPFFTTKTSGTGLGLAYSRKVIEGMKGEISLSNRVRTRGAVLTLRLPASEV